MPRISPSDLESLEHLFQVLYLPLCPESHPVSCENNSVSGILSFQPEGLSYCPAPSFVGTIPKHPPPP